jgi:hypothetical protein
MTEGNGVAPRTNPSADVVERMNDASEIPPPPGPKAAATARHGARRPAAKQEPAALSDEQVAQAARDELYLHAQVPENLQQVFNKLNPEEIMLVIAFVEGAHVRGIEYADSGKAVQDAFERGQAVIADGPPMRRLVEFMTGMLHATEDFLEVEEPNVIKFLKVKHQLFQKFQANAAAGT